MMHALEELNEQQRRAVTHAGGPVLVLAGAGSGKTRVVTQRIAYLMDQGLPGEEIVALTFTNKAAGEMKQRLHRLLPPTARAPWIGTFHSFGLRILKELGERVGLLSPFALYDAEDAQKIMKKVLADHQLTLPPAQALRFISLAKNRAKEPDQELYSAYAEAQALSLLQWQTLYRQYQQALRLAGGVDFDDLLLLCVELLRDPQVRLMLQERWSYLLVDEYQDTNLCQYEMVCGLVGERRQLFVVGDPDQSIYSWRGAELSNILNFEIDFPDAEVILLEDNYRSSHNILEAASALIQHNQSRYKKSLRSAQGEGVPVLLVTAPHDLSEAEFVARRIEQLYQQGKDFDDIAVFYRTNFQSRAIEDALRRHALPYTISGGLSFYDRREVRDLLAYARLLHSNRDHVALERALGAPKRGIGEKTLEKIWSYALVKGREPLELLGDAQTLKDAGCSPKVRLELQAFYELMQRLGHALQGQLISAFLPRLIEETGYENYLRKDPEGLERLENVQELVAKALEWEHIRHLEEEELPTGHEALRLFLEEMSLGPQEFADEPGSSVRLMTVHHAKGLEFSTVFLVGLEELLFPHVHHQEEESKIEEERRLMYVGMTRARHELFLCHARSRFLWGSIRRMNPSRFLYELPYAKLRRLNLPERF